MDVETGASASRTKNEVAGIRKIGRRAYLVRADERPLATNGRWELSEFMKWRRGEWVSLKLFDTHSQVRKRVYQLGYNVELGRMARNISKADLQDRYPEIHDWVCEQMDRLHREGAFALKPEPAR